jgi:hypothetical protein
MIVRYRLARLSRGRLANPELTDKSLTVAGRFQLAVPLALLGRLRPQVVHQPVDSFSDGFRRR